MAIGRLGVGQLGNFALGGGPAATSVPLGDTVTVTDQVDVVHIVEVTTAITADSAITADLTTADNTAVSFNADSSVGATLDLDAVLAADLLADSALSAVTEGDVVVDASIVAGSTITAALTAADAASASLVANSSVGAALRLVEPLTANISANSTFSVVTQGNVALDASIVAGSAISADFPHQEPVLGFGIDPMGSSPYGSGILPFGVQSATSLSPEFVEIRFTALVDFSYAPVLSPATYTFTNGLTAIAVYQQSGLSVRVFTTPQSAGSYTVTVNTARAASGVMIDPSLKQATFSGQNLTLTAFSLGLAPTRVRVVFDAPMTVNAALTNPFNYTVTDLNGNDLIVTAVSPEAAIDPISVVLTLATPLQTTETYEVTISDQVRSIQNRFVSPASSVFQWVEDEKQFRIPFDAFTGEVQGGLFGTHGGLVYFSPSLDSAAPNSVIQVDEVDVCTTAYDTYRMPIPRDPSPLFTYSPTGPVSRLDGSSVCWAPWPRLQEAQVNLGDAHADTLPQASDSRCIATFREPWDHTYVSLLNNTYWTLFDNSGNAFITANNLAPIPAGPMSTVTLEP